MVLKRSCRPLAFTSYKAFLKHKKRTGTSFSASFSTWFLRKIFVNQIVSSWNLKLTLSFQSSRFFLYDQKVKTKTEIPWERKEPLRWNKKHFSSLLNWFQWRK